MVSEGRRSQRRALEEAVGGRLRGRPGQPGGLGEERLVVTHLLEVSVRFAPKAWLEEHTLCVEFRTRLSFQILTPGSLLAATLWLYVIPLSRVIPRDPRERAA